MTDIVRIGSEILVNTTTPGDQAEPRITTLSNGGFVVTWNEGEGGVVRAVEAQVFAADGSEIGSETLVSTTRADMRSGLQITALSSGGFVVTWDQSKARPIGPVGPELPALQITSEVHAQVFAADATKIGSEIVVAQGVSEIPDARGTSVGSPQITALTSGGFVVSSTSRSSALDNTDIEVGVFAANGASIGSGTIVNTATGGSRGGQQITALHDGGFIVTWTDDSSGVGGATGDASGSAVKAQVFAPDGTKLGAEVLVNTATESGQFGPQITALHDGGFVVTWTDDSRGVGGATGDAGATAVKAQVFAPDGTKLGVEILVNTATEGRQFAQQITALQNGGFVVTWADGSNGVGGATGDASGSAVKAQVFAPDGAKIGTEILVNTATEGEQRDAWITALADGGFVVTWVDASHGVGGATGDMEATSVKAQAFAADGTKIGTEILVNTATDGDQGTPRITALHDGGFVVTWGDTSQGVGGATGDASGIAVKAQVFTLESAIVGTPDDDALTGTPDEDSILGLAGNDELQGLAGADRLDGGAGEDTADYSERTAGVVVTLDETRDATVTIGGVAEDTIRNIENLNGGLWNDFLAGDGLANVLFGDYGDDELIGGSGDDTLVGGPGADRLDGGAGSDTADYSNKWGSVVVSLDGAAEAIVTVGGMAEDTIRDIENVNGGRGNDILIGDGLANLLAGGGGNDRLTGGGDADLFRFAPGDRKDEVLDFEDNVDAIGLQGFGFASVEQALGFATQSGSRVVFDFGGGDVLTVHAVTVAALADDVLIV